MIALTDESVAANHPERLFYIGVLCSVFRGA